MFAELASNDTDSLANQLQGALRRGDMSDAIRIVAPRNPCLGCVAPRSELTDALAELAGGSEAKTVAALTQIVNGGGREAGAAAAALKALQSGDRTPAVELIAAAVADNNTETALALTAMADADGASFAEDAEAFDNVPKTTNALQGIRDFVVPLIGLSQSLFNTESQVGTRRLQPALNASPPPRPSPTRSSSLHACLVFYTSRNLPNA